MENLSCDFQAEKYILKIRLIILTLLFTPKRYGRARAKRQFQSQKKLFKNYDTE